MKCTDSRNDDRDAGASRRAKTFEQWRWQLANAWSERGLARSTRGAFDHLNVAAGLSSQSERKKGLSQLLRTQKLLQRATV